MNSPLRIGLLTVCVAAGLIGGDAVAQKSKYNPFTLMKSLKKEKKKSGARGSRGPKRIREGAFKIIKNKTISMAGGKSLKLSDVIKANFGASQKKEGARGAKSATSRGLYVKPAVEEHAVETKDSFVVSRRTTYVVTNPSKHGVKGHRAKKGSRGGRAKKRVKKGQFKLNKVPATQRKFFKERVIPSLAKLPKDHPFKKAYAKDGMAGVLNAFADGKGDYSVSDEVIIPKENPVMINGRVRFPGMFMASPKKGARGKVARFQTTKKIDWLANANKPKTKELIAKPDKKYTYQETGGELSYTHKFLTGWTWSKHWEKRHHKDYWFLEYEFWAKVGFTIGFRVPVKFKGKMSPAYIKTVSNKKSGDKKGSFSVKLSADVFDGDTDYYKSVGWTDKDRKARGKEFPFHLYLDAGARVEVCWKDILDKKIGWELDYSHDLKPVYGTGQVLKMKGPDNKWKNAAFYIPSEITQTVWRVGNSDLWAKAEGLIGAEFGGDGSVSAKVQPVIDGKVGKAKKITLTRGQTKTAGPFTIPKKSNFGTTKYGYKISDPRYRWKMKIRPAVKAVVSGECDHWWCGYVGPKTYTLGPWYPIGWISLGTIELDRHKGTTPSYKSQDGKKEFVKGSGSNEMHVCLKTFKNGAYLQVSDSRLDRVHAQYGKCSLNSTFTIRSASTKSGEKNIPVLNGGQVSLKTTFGRYLSVNNMHKLRGNASKVGKNERFTLNIVGTKKRRALKAGDKINLKTAHGLYLAAINGGGKEATANRKNAKTWERFKVEETTKKKFSWTCNQGKRDGHSNCKIKKIDALKKMGDACNRDGTKCPCYIHKPKSSKTAEIWCLEKLTMKTKAGKNKGKVLTKAKGVCSKKATRRAGRVKTKMGVGNKVYNVTSTECLAATFDATLPKAACRAKSAPTTNVAAGPVAMKLSNWTYLQNKFSLKDNASCPYWISSKYKQIVTRATPVEK